MAEVIFSDVSKVKNVESGKAAYTAIQIENVKKLFNIEGMPLSEFDCVICKKRLYMLHDSIRDKRYDEAEVIFKELAKLVNLKFCDDDLPILYRLLDACVIMIAWIAINKPLS